MQEEIISTLAHYQAEKEMPLSAFEIYKYLHNSEKISGKSITQEDTRSALQELLENGTIKEKDGFYFLKPLPENAIQKRIEREGESIKKWKKTKRVVWLMQIIPFVKTIAVTGSLSMNNATKRSDIDLFFITSKNRIWTVRTLAMLLTHAMGQRRRGDIIENKICLNFFLTENTEPPIQNLGYANIFLRAIPVLGKGSYLDFFKQNSHWMQRYFKNTSPSIEQEREAGGNKILTSTKKLFERALSGKAGDRLENIFFNWQTNRINRKLRLAEPHTSDVCILHTSDVCEKKEDLAHLIYTKDIIMLHYPSPRNEEVMAKYEKIIKA